jgi:hypothetical protein
VTSVNASGGTTGLSFTGGPVTTSGTLTLGGTLAVASGGTGRAVGNYSVYANEIHVSNLSGNDTTGDGTLVNPVATVTKALTLLTATARTVIMHPGVYAESPTVSATNTTITTLELTGANTELTGTLTLSAAARISGLKMNNLTITGSGSTYISNCTVDTRVIKSGSNYVEIINSELQCTLGVQITGAGVVSIVGNKCWAVAVSNASANVIIKDCFQVITPSVTAGSLSLDGCVITAAAPASNAITAGAGSFITLANSFALNSAGTSVERVSLAGFYSILNFVYDKPNSTFAGTNLNAIDYFSVINADTLVLTNDLTVANGGTGASTLTANGVLYGSGTSAIAATAVGTTGQVLIGNTGAAPSWDALSSNAVSSFSAGTTGLTPSTSTTGSITLAGTLALANGGTGATTAPNARTNLSAAASGANTDITSIALTTGTIITAPTSGTDIVNKTYADTIASGINFHQSVDLATVAALPANTYNNGTSGVGATLTANANGALSIDGVAVVAGDRVLIKNEVTQANNGVYVVTQTGSGAAVYILTRATDFDSAGSGVDQIDQGDFFLVTGGSTLANTSWVQQTPLPITVGTTSIVFLQFGAPITYSAGTGLTLGGTVFSITNTGVSAATYGSASSVPVVAVNAQGQATSVTNTPIAIAATQITSGVLPAANGGTGLSSPGTAGNVLTSTGTAWVSQLAPAGGITYTTVKTSNYTASNNDGVQTSTSGGAFTVTLPATPAVGAQVFVIDTSSSWATNNLTVGRNGSTIEGSASDLICDISNVSVQLVYSGTTWNVYAQVGGAGGAADINTQTTGTLNVSRGGTGATTLTGYVKGSGTSTMTASATIPTSDLTGTLGVANGGTGAATLTGIVKGTGTSALTAGTVSLTSEVTGTLPVANGGTGVTASTGTVAVVLSNSPTLVTPTLGAASATSVAAALGSVGAPSYTFTGDTNTGIYSPAADTMAFVEGGVEALRITSTGGITSADLVDAVGYKGLPQNSQTASYTLALADMGKMVNTTTGGVVIPANASVAFPIGSAISIYNNSASSQTISITTDTIYLAGTATTGSRTLAQRGLATCVKVAATTWVVSGAGVT